MSNEAIAHAFVPHYYHALASDAGQLQPLFVRSSCWRMRATASLFGLLLLLLLCIGFALFLTSFIP